MAFVCYMMKNPVPERMVDVLTLHSNEGADWTGRTGDGFAQDHQSIWFTCTFSLKKSDWTRWYISLLKLHLLSSFLARLLILMHFLCFNLKMTNTQINNESLFRHIVDWGDLQQTFLSFIFRGSSWNTLKFHWIHLPTQVPLGTVYFNGTGLLFFWGFYEEPGIGIVHTERILWTNWKQLSQGFFQAILRRMRLLFLIMKFCL